jgi:tRNA-dihydrouridine synthase
MEATKGERSAILQMRKHIAWYLRGLYDSAKIRAQIFRLETKHEVIETLKKALGQLN